MSTKSSTRSMPSSNTSFTERRDVIQQFDSQYGEPEVSFTVEVTKDDEVLLKCFTDASSIIARMNYDTAFALQQSISDALDEIEENMDPMN